MPTWYYFSRPTNLAFHDLTTSTKPPSNLKHLLGLSLKFCPTPRFTTSSAESTLKRLKRSIYLKAFFAGTETEMLSKDDIKMYVPSKWTPPEWEVPKEVKR